SRHACRADDLPVEIAEHDEPLLVAESFCRAEAVRGALSELSTACIALPCERGLALWTGQPGTLVLSLPSFVFEQAPDQLRIRHQRRNTLVGHLVDRGLRRLQVETCL